MFVQGPLADAQVTGQIVHVEISTMAVDFTKGFCQDLGADIFCHVNTSYLKKIQGAVIETQTTKLSTNL